MTGSRIVVPLVLAIGFAIAALAVVPRGYEAQALLSVEDDPVSIAEQVLNHRFDASAARREINAALAANDPDLAKSFADLARERGVLVEPELSARVEDANAASAQAARAAGSFTRGLITGEPEDLV